MHFNAEDFTSLKRNSLVGSICSEIDVPATNKKLLEEKDLNITCDNGKGSSNKDSMFVNQDKDTFQCGKCKIQFEQLTQFIEHKRLQCKILKSKLPEDATEIDCSRILLKSTLENSENSENSVLSLDAKYFSFNGESIISDSSPQEVNSNENGILEIVNGESQEEPTVISFVISQDEKEVKNQVLPLSQHATTMTPKILGNDAFLIDNTNDDTSGANIILSGDEVLSEGDIVLTCPIESDVVAGSAAEEEIGRIFVTEPNVNSFNNFLLNESINTHKSNGSISAGQIDNLLRFICGELPVEKKEIRAIGDSVGKDAKKAKAKLLSCSFCGKTFEKPFNLQQHERVHTGERPFQCIVCGRAFSQKSNVRKHMMRHKVWPQANQTLKIVANECEPSGDGKEFPNHMNYYCQYCSLSFNSYSLYKKHLSLHSNFKVYRCIQKGCDETFSDLDEYLLHSKIHSSAEFRCHICLKSFTSLGDLGAHQYDHDINGRDRRETEVKLKCEVCHAQFKTAESLKNHLAVDTHNYECVRCRTVFSSERFLRRHLATHSDPSQSKFKCPDCKKSFRTQKYLNNHMFVHLNEKPFNCEHCDKQFASKYRLNRHVAIHSNQYFECPFKVYLGCNKKFYRRDKLRDHLTTHGNCRLRACQVCSKTFASVAKLNQHTKREHPTGKIGQVLRCANCSQTFRKQKQLTQHHCTVGKRKFKSNSRNPRASERGKDSETVSNIEIFMVPYASDPGNE